jgi:hypothetical protein
VLHSSADWDSKRSISVHILLILQQLSSLVILFHLDPWLYRAHFILYVDIDHTLGRHTSSS